MENFNDKMDKLYVKIDPVNANIPEGVELNRETWKVPTITSDGV